MAGQWVRTRTPGVHVQEDSRTGKPRYKLAFRDARGVVTSPHRKDQDQRQAQSGALSFAAIAACRASPLAPRRTSSPIRWSVCTIGSPM